MTEYSASIASSTAHWESVGFDPQLLRHWFKTHSYGQRYRLLAWCLMPNHVHVVMDMLEGKASLGAIVRSWKSFTARRANEQLGRSGAFWHADYFDRYR